MAKRRAASMVNGYIIKRHRGERGARLTSTPRTTESAYVSAYPWPTPEDGAAHSALRARFGRTAWDRYVWRARCSSPVPAFLRGRRLSKIDGIVAIVAGEVGGTHIRACSAGGVLARTARVSSFPLGAGARGRNSDSAPLRRSGGRGDSRLHAYSGASSGECVEYVCNQPGAMNAMRARHQEPHRTPAHAALVSEVACTRCIDGAHGK
ncbi:hypothetical protein FB451DRAFT_1228835 [Mycena latifolia]|nr:hypothetical protein FB451DRAFT_1228835 [Mycena latifolia]